MGDGLDHDTDLAARGADHSAFALIANDTIALIKQATEKHVSWIIDPADDTRYRFERGFDFLLMLCPTYADHRQDRERKKKREKEKKRVSKYRSVT